MYEADLTYSLSLKSTVGTHENADCLFKNTFTYYTYFVPVFKYCYSDSRNLGTVMRAGGLAL